MRRICLWVSITAFVSSASGQFVRVDPTFTPQIDGWVRAIALQHDGKILVGGQFTNVNGIARPRLARLNSNGSLDESFSPNGDTLAPAVFRLIVTETAIYAQTDDTGPNGTRKLNYSGIEERAYPLGSPFIVDSRERLLWGHVNEAYYWNRIGRLNADGSHDQAFSVFIGCCHNMGVNAVAIQTEGAQSKILLGGDFTEVGTNVYFGLARLNDDGSVDNTFRGGTTEPVVDIKPWGKEQFYAATERSISRHFADGTLDSGFLTGPYDGLKVQEIFPYSEGEVLALLNDTGARVIRRYRNDGTVDTNFSVKTEGVAITAAVQMDEGILIGGTFTSVNCLPRQFLARLIPSSSPDPLPCVPQLEPSPATAKLPGGKILVNWPDGYSDYVLQAARRLRPRQPEKEKWVTVTNEPVCNEFGCSITNKISRYGKHYRLVKP